MSGPIGFGARPTTPDAWVRDGKPQPRAEIHTARLTVDITPELRGRIKVAAFRKGVTMAALLRALFEDRFPEEDGR